METFEYSSDNLIMCVPSTHFSPESQQCNKFDALLCKTWNDAKVNGFFRYKLDDLQTKILPGKYGFVAQLNVIRAVERRRPQNIMSISQPFNPSEFNFTKVAQREILFQIKNIETEYTDDTNTNKGKRQLNGDVNDDSIDKISPNHLMIINVSPLEFGNSLMVPFVDSCLPQVLSAESIKMAMELVLASSTPSFRAGFNSLCASASVNHHHFHVYYLPYSLPIETMDVECLVGDCFVTVGYPAVGFVFQLKNKDVSSLARYIFRVANYMQGHNIAHNLMVTRAAGFKSADPTSYDVIRIYLWARKSCYGIKDDTAFNVACCEVSGHLPIKHEHSFGSITEDDVAAILDDACLGPFTEIKQEILNLLS